MPGDCIPASLQGILDAFASCFTRPSFENFLALTCGWILCRTRRWITRAIVASGVLGRKHHSSFYRFFSSARWVPDALGHSLFRLLLPYLPRDIEAMVDDTLCRRSGPRIFGVSMQRDGAASSYGRGGPAVQAFACGHSWVVLSVRLPLPWNPQGCAIPILARLYRSPKRCPEAEYNKRTQLARQLIDMLAKSLPEGRTLHLTGDREYACRTVLRDLDSGVQFTGPLVMDAMLYDPVSPRPRRGVGRPRVHGERLASPKQRAHDKRSKWEKISVVLYGGRATDLLIQSWTCLWYTGTRQRLVRVVLTRDPKGNYDDRAFFSTEHSASAAKILQRFVGRWLIEVSFRDTKQLFGLVDPQNGFSRGVRSKKKPGPQPRGNRGRRAVERTAPFIWTVYGIVIVWYLGEGRWQRDVQALRKRAPWYRSKRSPSFEDMLDALRTELLVHRVLGHPLLNRTRAETRRALRDLGMAA